MFQSLWFTEIPYCVIAVSVYITISLRIQFRADSRCASSQWETSLQSNAVSHWLGANLEYDAVKSNSVWKAAVIVYHNHRLAVWISQDLILLISYLRVFTASTGFNFDTLQIRRWYPNWSSKISNDFAAFRGLTHWDRDKMASIWSIQISNACQKSLRFFSLGPINNISAFVQLMSWHLTGDKPISERTNVESCTWRNFGITTVKPLI